VQGARKFLVEGRSMLRPYNGAVEYVIVFTKSCTKGRKGKEHIIQEGGSRRNTRKETFPSLLLSPVGIGIERAVSKCRPVANHDNHIVGTLW
jgi:hypothetical protein